MQNNQPLTIVGDGNQRRDFTHVSDVVKANILAATTEVNNEAFGQVYNIGNGVNYSVNQIAAIISDNTTFIPPRIGESRETLSDTNKFRSTFGWEPKVALPVWIKTQL